MSEYQYYEFQAIHRPLTHSQMREVRNFSTRATITPTRFVNEYHWGDFKGKIFRRVFLLRQLGFVRLNAAPACRLLGHEVARQYCCEDSAQARLKLKGEYVILEFHSEG